MHSNACTHCSMNEISIVKVYMFILFSYFVFILLLHFNLFLSIFFNFNCSNFIYFHRSRHHHSSSLATYCAYSNSLCVVLATTTTKIKASIHSFIHSSSLPLPPLSSSLPPAPHLSLSSRSKRLSFLCTFSISPSNS